MLTTSQAKEMARRSAKSRLSKELIYARTIPDRLRAEAEASNKPAVAKKYGISVRALYKIINGK